MKFNTSLHQDLYLSAWNIALVGVCTGIKDPLHLHFSFSFFLFFKCTYTFAKKAADSIFYKLVYKAIFHLGFHLLGILLHLAMTKRRMTNLQNSDLFFLTWFSNCKANKKYRGICYPMCKLCERISLHDEFKKIFKA